MIKSLTIPITRSGLSGTLPSYQSLLAIVKAVFGPSRWLTGIWLLTICTLLLGVIFKAGLPIITGSVSLLVLHLTIPIQINNLSGRKSWLLLPGFKPLVLTLLGALLVLWLLVFLLIISNTPNPKWIVLPYVALVFSLVMLPAIYVRHLWPLLAQIVLLVAIVGNDGIRSWLKAHGTDPWFGGVIAVSTLLLWLLMAYRWLHPAQRERSKAKKTSVYALYGIEIQPLMRLTRRPASLAGTLLLGDGDSWIASVVRAIWATWLLPALIMLSDLMFAEQGDAPFKLWSAQSFLVLLILCPLFTLAAQQQKAIQRLGRCWLYLSGSRQTMYGFAERAFYQELLAYLPMTLVLAFVLVPLPMILPLLCYAAAATLLLCYLIFVLVGQAFWWSISANLLLLLALMVAMDFLWGMPQLIYLTSLALVLPVYSLRRYGKAYWLKLDYTQLKPRQLL